jgi:CRP-like cAMP-binding protein
VYQIRHFLGGENMLNAEEMKIIKASFLFSQITDAEFNNFLNGGECYIRDFSKGENIFIGGNGEKSLGVLLLGKATALCSDKGSLKVFSSGDAFGVADVFNNTSGAPYSIMKATSNCRVFFVTKNGVEKLIRANPETAIKYISFLSDRVAFLNRRISTFTSKEAISRMAKYLLDNCDENFICKNINFSALAKNLDIGRASLYRVKNELIKLKAISAENKDIIITDRNALKNII